MIFFLPTHSYILYFIVQYRRRTCNIARTFYNFIAPLFLFIFLDRQLKKPADKFSNWVYFVALSLRSSSRMGMKKKKTSLTLSKQLNGNYGLNIW